MAKKDNTVNLNNIEKEFMNRFQKLCHTRQSWEVWSDMVNMFARSYSNFPESVAITDPEKRSERWKKREQEYLHLIGKYPEDEQKIFPELHALMVTELERRNGDFLGDMYMKLNLGSHWHGQFFTPKDVAELMSAITVPKDDLKAEIEEKGFISICDPACGAGVNLLATVRTMMLEGIDFQTKAVFVGQDIDGVAGLMCYVQLCAFGCAGYVCIADTLANPITGSDVLLVTEMPDQEWWYTPTWFTPIWAGRRTARRMDRIIRASGPVLPASTATFTFNFGNGAVSYG